MGDRIGVLNKGALVQVGTPHEIYNDPVNTFVARAVGSPAMNLLPGKLQSGRAVMGEGLVLDHPANHEGRDMIFGVRPEDLHLEAGAAVEARVTDVENHGVEKIVTLSVADKLLRATVPVTQRVAKDETVRLGWNSARVIVFDQAGNRAR